MKIPFLDLTREYKDLKKEIDAALKKVFSRGNYVLGQEVENFEMAFANFIGVKFAIGVGSGTEAIHLALLATGIQPGDEVITASNTCAPTICAIMASGAIPILTDVDPQSYCLDVSGVARKITRKTKAIVPVHLYGQTADMQPLINLSKKYGLSLIEDCAQAHGAKYNNRYAGSFGLAGAFSFYPTKNLGAFGDGGMITTNSEEIARKCRLLRNYGQKNRYEHVSFGINSRLDEIQAAILNVKFKRVNAWNKRRRRIAKRYSRSINNPLIVLPKEMDYACHIYHLYVVRTNTRKAFCDYLENRGISTFIHYPIPIHKQKFYQRTYQKRGNFPVAEKFSREIVSIPLYPYLKEAEINYIVDTINAFKG